MWIEKAHEIRSINFGGGTVVPSGTYAQAPLNSRQAIAWPPRQARIEPQVYIVAAPRIVQTPGIVGGKPRIVGRRISVQDIVIWHHHLGLSVEEITAKYDLSPGDVKAALTYYANHRDEIEETIRASEAFVSEMRQRHPSKLKA